VALSEARVADLDAAIAHPRRATLTIHRFGFQSFFAVSGFHRRSVY
jgi:hypothetical protein